MHQYFQHSWQRWKLAVAPLIAVVESLIHSE
jgi:hypothetical protein